MKQPTIDELLKECGGDTGISRKVRTKYDYFIDIEDEILPISEDIAYKVLHKK